MRLRATHHSLAPPIPDDTLVRFRAGPVVTVEWSSRHIVIELRALGGDLRLESVKHFLRQSAWIVFRLYHQWRHRSDHHRFCHAAFAVARQIMDYFASASRVADMHGILEIEMLGQRREIVRIMIHVVAVVGLRRAAM